MSRRGERPADDRTTTSFLRGMTLGAIVGAIIAGSSLWARWRGARRQS
ncbi:MAG: hypothetical protein ACJ77C_06590 [Chloroflexota bacterium]